MNIITEPLLQWSSIDGKTWLATGSKQRFEVVYENADFTYNAFVWPKDLGADPETLDIEHAESFRTLTGAKRFCEGINQS